MIKQLVISITLCSLVACASTEEGPAKDSYGAESTGSDCISLGSIRDYKVLDNANLLVTQGVKRKYHVQLSRPAYGLRSSNSIGLHSRSGRICGGFSELLLDEGLQAERIRIRSIQQLSPESEEDLLIRFGIIEPEFEQPRRPVDIEGAEVEELD